MADVRQFALDGTNYSIKQLDAGVAMAGNNEARVIISGKTGIIMPEQVSDDIYAAKVEVYNETDNTSVTAPIPTIHFNASNEGVLDVYALGLGVHPNATIDTVISEITFSDSPTGLGQLGNVTLADAAARARLDTAEGNITQLQTDVAAADAAADAAQSTASNAKTAADNAQSRADAAYSLAESAGGVRIVTTAAEFVAANNDDGVAVIAIAGDIVLDNPTVRKQIIAVSNLVAKNKLSGTINSQGCVFTGINFGDTIITGSSATFNNCVITGTINAQNVVLYVSNSTATREIIAGSLYAINTGFNAITTQTGGGMLKLVQCTSTSLQVGFNLYVSNCQITGPIRYNSTRPASQCTWIITGSQISTAADNFVIGCPGDPDEAQESAGYCIITGNRLSAGGGTKASITAKMTGLWYGTNLYNKEWA